MFLSFRGNPRNLTFPPITTQPLRGGGPSLIAISLLSPSPQSSPFRGRGGVIDFLRVHQTLMPHGAPRSMKIVDVPFPLPQSSPHAGRGTG
jgi:hypothetical protein